MRLTWEAPAILRWLLPLVVPAAGLWIRRLYLRTEPHVAPAVRRRLLALRWGVLVLLVLGAAQPRLVLRRTVDVPPSVVVMVDDTASMARADGPGGLTRWQQALRVVARVDSLVGAADRDVRLLVLRGNGLSAPDSLRPRVPPAAQGGDPAALARRGLLAAGPEADPLVILVSDGHTTVSGAGGMSWPGTVPPVLVGVGKAAADRDVRLVDLRYPRRVRAGDTAVLAVALAPGDTASSPLTVAVVAGDSTIATVHRPVPAGGGLWRGELSVPIPAPGLHLLRVVVTGAGGDTLLTPVELAIRATRRERRLLVVAPRPGWLSRFLLQACALTGEIRGEAAWPTPRGWLRGDSLCSWSPPTTPDGWRRWDAVFLLGDGRDLPAAAVTALAAAVRKGTGLALVAEAASATHEPPPVLRPLLPVKDLRTPRPGTWRLLAGSVAAPPPDLAAVFWRQGVRLDDLPPWLPPLDWLVPARPREGALVLVAGQPRGGGAPLPVVVRTGGGAGRRLWLASSALWLDAFWRSPLERSGAVAGATAPFRRWLGALLVDLVQGEGLVAPVVLEGMRDLYRAGERVPLRAVVETPGMSDSSLVDHVAAVLVTAVPVGPDSLSAASVRLRGRGRSWRGELPPLSPGVHLLRALLVTADGDTLRGRPVRLAVAAGSPEDDQTGQNVRHLRDLAAGWGGILVDAAAPQADRRLASRLQERLAQTHRLTRVRVVDPLRSPWFLGLLVLLLAGEWWLRRRHGMQ